MKRENVVGRANVEDTPALEDYYRELERFEAGALWNVANEIEPWLVPGMNFFHALRERLKIKTAK